MIRLHGHLICTTEAEAETVRAYLPDHLALTRAEPGCLSFEVNPTDDPLIYEVRETFRDRDSFDAHQARTRGSPWYAATHGILRDFHLNAPGG